MIALLQTAERTNNLSQVNNYVLHRHIFAYTEAKKYLSNAVIELGCGNGYGMKILAPFCNWYVGIDKTLKGSTSLSANAAFFKSCLPNLNNIGDHSFETVICFQVIEHIKEDDRLMSEIYRILKPGGKLLLTTPNKLMSLTRNPFHIREYTPATMEKVLAATFNKFELKGIYGNDNIMNYYEKNKQSVENITRWDILNLQYRLPASLLKIPYSIANNINRLMLYKNNPATCAAITYEDYFIDDISNECIDFFVVAEK